MRHWLVFYLNNVVKQNVEGIFNYICKSLLILYAVYIRYIIYPLKKEKLWKRKIVASQCRK
jgi:hypothetical protein